MTWGMPNYQQSLERFEAWWQGLVLDRPVVRVAVKPDHAPKLPQKTHASQRERWMDIEYKLDVFEASLSGQVIAGDVPPIYMPQMGPEICAALFGAELEFSETTNWSVPVLEKLEDVFDLKPDFGNPYWQTVRTMVRRSLERSEGRWITGHTDLHTNADLLAALRDPQELCLDMAVDIDLAARAVEYLTDFFPAIYDDLYAPVAAAGQPSTTWLPSLHMGRSYAVSCDLICMISPVMFDKTVLPSLKREMAYLDRSIFHLDGPGAIQHLDALLACEDLHAVQWVWGAGNEPGSRPEWIKLYQRVQAAGKSIMVICTSIDDAMAVLPHVQPEGLWLFVSTEYTPKQAQEFLDYLTDWTAKNRKA